MSADTSIDVTGIHDEDILKRMWQETDDFGRKKEIRAHMYKLREARLRDFYNNGEVNSEIQRTTKSNQSAINKLNTMTTHTDNLADHSFMSLKSKEIRDSESPTRDVSYKISNKQNVDQGWTITSGSHTSEDGKTHTTTQSATTSGTQLIEGGKVDYDAKAQQKSSLYQDGDDKNFVRGSADSSSSVIHQEAVGGDDNSSFKATSTKTSSSSRYVSESKSTSGDFEPKNTILPASNLEHTTSNHNVTTRVYTTNAPKDVKSHPNYIEGNTKVTQETKTLPDGTTVTTTKYETKKGNSIQTSTHKKYSSVASSQSEQKMSSSSSTKMHSSSTTTSQSGHDSKHLTSTSNNRAIEYISEPGSNIDINIKVVRDNTDQNRQNVSSVSKSEHVSTSQHQSNVSEQSHYSQNIENYSTSNVTDTRVKYDNQKITDISPQTQEYRTTSTKITSYHDVPRDTVDNVNYSTSTESTTVVSQNQNRHEDRRVISDQFISTERQHEKDTRDSTTTRQKPHSPERKPITPKQEITETKTTERYVTETRSDVKQQPTKPYQQPDNIPQETYKQPIKSKPTPEPYEQPERRQPIKPGKSEMDRNPQPTEGQYDTTYRTDFTSKKISVEVSASHDAFARSLRSITPERIARHPPGTPKSNSPNLRNSVSPEKNRYPSRSGSPRKSDKFSSSETITYSSSPDRRSPTKSPERNTDTFSRRRKDKTATTTSKTEYDTITRNDRIANGTVENKRTNKPKPRSPSPSTTITSDFEYIRNVNDVTTDLDEEIHITHKDTRPTSLDVTTKTTATTKKTRKVTERSPTSPLTDIVSVRKSPVKDVTKKSPLVSPTKDTPKKVPLPEDRPLKRTDTYEERVKEILGLTNVTSERRRSSLERNSLKRGSFTKDSVRSPSSPKLISPTKEKPKDDLPTQTRRSPTKDEKPGKKETSKISEFPSQVRKSPEKQTFEKYPERKSPSKEGPKISEFPSQIRTSVEKEPLEKYPEKKTPTKEAPKINEFPAQVRRSPEKQPLDKYPEKKSPLKETPTRRSPEKTSSVSLSELPKQPRSRDISLESLTQENSKTISRSQQSLSTRRSPEKEYPQYDEHSPKKLSEFPSQIRKTPEREFLEPYPQKTKPEKKAPSIDEFPSQVRRSPQKEPLEPYPEKSKPKQQAPLIDEFPSQIRKSPQKEPLEPYPEKVKPQKKESLTGEFPYQTRKTPQKEPLEPYPEKRKPQTEKPSVNEFPSQIRKSEEKVPLEPYPEKSKPKQQAPLIDEFPFQIRKSPEKEPLEPYPEKIKPQKKDSSIGEFPYQTRKTPQKEPLEPYPEKSKPQTEKPSINEFPSQIRKTPQKVYPERYPEKSVPEKKGPAVGEFPSQITRSPERDITPAYTVMSKKTKKPKDRSPVKDESSTTEDEEEIEETIVEKSYSELENKIPVNEPLVTKKFIDQLCREEEIQRTDITSRKSTEQLLEKEILETEDATKMTSTIKKDKPPKKSTDTTTKKTSDTTFIEKEREQLRNTTTITTKKETLKEVTPIKQRLDKTPSKKTIVETTSTTTKTTTKKVPTKSIPKGPTPKQQPGTTYKTEKSKFIGETEYKTAYTGKESPSRKQQKPTEKITLWNVENLDKVKPDASVHIRTHRIDESETKKSSTLSKPKLNGETPKTKPKDAVTEQPTRRREPITKTPENKPKYTSTVKKTILTEVRPTKPAKAPESTTPKKHVVTATITVSAKSKTPTRPISKAASPTVSTTRTKKVTETRTQVTKQPKLQNGHVSSDTEDESLVDSVEDLTLKVTTDKRKITRTTSDQVIKTHKPPARGFSKPELGSQIKPEESPSRTSRKPESKCITTKTVIINNRDTNAREIIVDLQRSKSSREPTPDRLCPLPVTSDEEEDLPRYPDQISEPDDGSLRRKPKKLNEIPILEDEDTQQFTRITEIDDTSKKITEVDRVEETDESLLSVNKKINKFLDTAEQLTKEPLKPRAPKVQRPTLIVTDDLKTDECLLSVSDKVNKFITTAEQLVAAQSIPERPKSPKCKNYPEIDDENFETRQTTIIETTTKPKGPAAKVERPDLSQENETIRNDVSSLSVSDKVSKFITAAEKLKTTETVSLSKIDVKSKSEKQPSPRPREREASPVKKPTTFDTEECVQIETEEQTFRRRTSPERISPTRRSPSPKTEEKTPNRRPSNHYTSVLKTESVETKYSKRDSSPKLTDSTPKSTRRPSQDEPLKPTMSSTSRLRSTESIKKAKALFENINKEQETVKQRDILSRPSVFAGRKSRPTENSDKTVKSKTTISTTDNLKSTKLVLEKIRNKSKSPEKSPETSRATSPKRFEITKFRSTSPDKVPEIVTTRSREPSPEYQNGDVPHYMKPLDRSLRPHSPHRDNVEQSKPSHPKDREPDDVRTTKFGVTLRRTDSGRTIKTTSDVTTERRKSSITFEKRVTEEEIDEIFELEILEELLEKVVGYELRRKIRTQIRLVKKLISENRLEEYISKRKTIPREAITRRGSSPSKTSKPSEIVPKITETKKETEYQSKYTRKASPQRTIVNNKLYQHTDIVDKSSDVRRTSEYQSSYTTSTERRTSSDYSKTTTTKSSSPVREKSPAKTTIRKSPERKTTRTIETTPTTKTVTTKTTESVPGGLRSTTTKTTESKTFTTLKKTTPIRKTIVVDEQPEWVKRNNLRKTTETTTPVTNKKVTSSTSSTTTSSTSKKTSVRSNSPIKETKPTDIITSSYGVGPTDENGTPLFGLKALRAQNRGEQTTKVQGTVITSEFYSENGHEPVGQVSVTKYSTDPKDLEQDGPTSKNKGVTSVTTTQKFGYKDTPSLKSLADNKKEICDTIETSETTTKTTKLNRRGSVKAISQKFIDNTVESLKNERQTSYPKAGLILRTSSFKDSSGSGSDDNRETSPAERETRSTVTVRSTRVSGGETFLTNKSRVAGVQDVITRMKGEDYQEGDTEDDIAARGLLNKFLGSQVILSGLESHHGATQTTTTSSSPSSTLRRTTKITTTITEGGKPTTSTRIFQRPVTEEELATVWDEQTLRLLLEQSTDYEERRIIRARLRQVMAEQEACTELVDKASEEEHQEKSSGQIEEKTETTKETSTTGGTVTTKVTTKVTTQQMSKAKPISPFAKFRQLDKQNSLNKSTPPSTPGSPRTPGGAPLFKFTDPALTQSASTIKERLLHWCRMKTKEYENIQLDNFSTSWADGLAFCALIHHFLPDAFDYQALTPNNRKHNFELAFRVADEKADIAPLLDVEDMIETRRPDWKCVFTYVQSIYRRFKDED